MALYSTRHHWLSNFGSRRDGLELTAFVQGLCAPSMTAEQPVSAKSVAAASVKIHGQVDYSDWNTVHYDKRANQTQLSNQTHPC